MSNYQRGTDLKHCPDGCEKLAISSIPEDFMERLDCWATSCDTCPREQAERDEVCGTCEYRGSKAICSIRMMAVYVDDSCGEWKERTNE